MILEWPVPDLPRLTPITTSVPLPGLVHFMAASSVAAALPIDRRQSPMAQVVTRGTTRLLHSLGYCVVSEVALASGRRADLVALSAAGEIWIVEIKSSIADLRADRKWLEYRRHCDRLFFATTLEVPREVFPPDAGLIVADGFAAAITQEAPAHHLAAASRKRTLIAVARTAALRLAIVADPPGHEPQ
jgi:hypothetical protein